MHAAVYRAYPGVGAIVHTHSPKATALACAGLGIPPFHYMIALAGGDVRCMPYATFGTAELAAHAVEGETAFVEFHLSVDVPPDAVLVGAAVSVTVGSGATVSFAVCDTEPRSASNTTLAVSSAVSAR